MTTSSSTKKPDAGELDISRLAPTSRRAHEEREEAERDALKRTDGRTLRRKGRTETLSTKTTPETIQAIQRIATAEGMTMVEVVEKAVEVLDRHLRGNKT